MMARNGIVNALMVGCVLVALSGGVRPAAAHDTPAPHDADTAPAPGVHSEHGSLADIGAKLSDPTANIWALSFNFNALTFSDGDLNTGDPELGSNVVFQPVMPFPLYGTGDDQWKMITRPIIPITFNADIPDASIGDFRQIGGLGDIQLPLLLNPPKSLIGDWIVALGPVFEFPTSTKDALGSQQYSVGPAVAFGYKTKKWVAVTFTNYFFGIGDRSDRAPTTRTTSKMSLLYSFAYNLPNAWQIGFNPTISYNNKSANGNKWNVPVGLFAAKTLLIAGHPFKIQGGVEYSVVSQDNFGKRANFRIVVTPVIPGLVKKPIFGGG